MASFSSSVLCGVVATYQVIVIGKATGKNHPRRQFVPLVRIRRPVCHIQTPSDKHMGVLLLRTLLCTYYLNQQSAAIRTDIHFQAPNY